MRDVVAALVAAVLVFAALSLLTTLHWYRKRHRAARDQLAARGRTIIVELPTDPELTLVAEDAEHLYYGERVIDKRDIVAVRVLINGSPIASFALTDRPGGVAAASPAAADQSFEDQPDGILRDRWDVAIDTTAGTLLIECGAIRERVSQELARRIFDAVKATIHARAGLHDD
jgi:hypothetical protein